MRELRVAQQAGEDWAEEGGMHIFKVVSSFLYWSGALKYEFVELNLFLTSSRWSIRSWIEMVQRYVYLLNELFNLTQVVKEVGKRMMEKAYMGEPSRQSGSLSNEE